MTAADTSSLAVLLARGDITDRVFREMLEALPAAVYTTDAEGRLTYFNQAAVKLSGRVPQLGTDQWCVTWKIFLPDGTYLPHDECPMALALRGVQVRGGVECIAERPDGTRFWFAPYPAVIRNGEGRIIGGINLLMDITDRKKAEIQADQQFRAIVDTTPECVKIVARDGTLLFMNAAGLEMVGASKPEDLIGRNLYEIIAPEDRDRFREMNERVCGGGKASLEFDMIGFDGARHHMETHAAPLTYSDASTVHLAITRDVTKRRLTERDTLLLSAIVNSSDDAIISKNLDGVITSWNKSAERLFGYTAQEAIGKTIAELLIPEDRQDEEPDILARLRQGERVDHFETLRRRKDGSLFAVSLTISPIKDAQGKIVGASKVARDISERKRAEAQLAQSRHTFFELVERAPFGIYVVDSSLCIVQMNAGSQNRAFRNVRPVIGRDLGEALHIIWPAPVAEQAISAFRHTLATGEPFFSAAFTKPRKDIKAVESYEWELHRMRLPDGQYGVICYYFDSTELRNAEAALRSANQDLEQFAYSASHDLQEPLRSIKIYSELLEQRHGEVLAGDGKKFLSYLRSGATRMETLVRDLLAYTQATSSNAPPQITDANQALEAALSNLSSAISNSGARVISERLPAVAVHSTHLQQVFQNLVSNAIKYRSPDRAPVLRITAQAEDEYFVFSVADNGIGIDREYTETIFGLFKRLHSNDAYSGTGIGLAICKRIVDRYHGRIWVESEPGKGSTFRFTVPL
ncbi:MAG TPA: PAS domain S-box protein [Bryobacteraceae bacterium]|nr:PAS domain S-box protein [Bryobacteraceae bacterium]